jgi:thiamine kinase-like enzyme
VAIPSDREELICHNDLGPWNLIRSSDRWVFNWDGSGPSSRLWDLAYAAQSFVPLVDGGNPKCDVSRLRTFLDAYGLELKERVSFPNLLYQRTLVLYRLLEDGAKHDLQPWRE